MLKWLSRTETKVVAASAGSTVGVTLSAAAVWGLGVLISHVPPDEAHAAQAIDSVPKVLAGLVGLAVTGAVTWLAGWSASPSNHAGNPLVDIGVPLPADADSTSPHMEG